MSILFNRCASLQVDLIIFNIRKINSKSSQRCSFHPFPSCLCFPALPPLFFFKDSDFLIEYPFYNGSLSILFPSGSYPVILLKILTELLVHHSSFLLSSPVVSSQALLILPFYSFQCLLIPVHLIIIHFSLFICSGMLKFSQKARLVI